MTGEISSTSLTESHCYLTMKTDATEMFISCFREPKQNKMFPLVRPVHNVSVTIQVHVLRGLFRRALRISCVAKKTNIRERQTTMQKDILLLT